MSVDQPGEDLTEPMYDVAESLAALSMYEGLPGVVSRPQVPRTALEILANHSSMWLAVVMHEMEWLNLDYEVSVELFESDPLAAAQSLFTGMGVDQAETSQCVVSGDLGPRLTSRGIDLLADRLAAAERCAQVCLDGAGLGDDERSREDWEQAWSEEDIKESASPLPIQAKSETWPISTLAAKARQGQLVLNPTYQRDDVWKLSDSSELIESIFRGIPLPSIVLLEVPRPGQKSLYEVVDGKQRITSILRFIGKHPKAVEKAKELDTRHGNKGFVEALKNDYRAFLKLWKQHEGQKLTPAKETEFMLPFKVKGKKLQKIESLKECANQYFTDILTKPAHSEDCTVSDLFTETVDYKLLVITFSNTDPGQIHDVFQLYNRRGKHLNAEEIRNAVYHDLPLMRAILGAGQDTHDVAKLLSDENQGSKKLRDAVSRISTRLSDQSVTSERYRRTKLFAWVIASIFALKAPGGKLRVMSTAKQIEKMLLSIRDNRLTVDSWERLATTNIRGLEELFEALDDAVRVIDEEEAVFNRRFRSGGGSKWQDLQFVSALTTLLIARLTLGGEFERRIQSRASEIDAASGKLKRDPKSQNWTQWRFIGRAVCELLSALEVQPADVSAAFGMRFKHDPIPALQAARDLKGKSA